MKVERKREAERKKTKDGGGEERMKENKKS